MTRSRNGAGYLDNYLDTYGIGYLDFPAAAKMQLRLRNLRYGQWHHSNLDNMYAGTPSHSENFFGPWQLIGTLASRGHLRLGLFADYSEPDDD